MGNPLGDAPCSDNSRNAVFSRDDGTVAEDTPDVGNQSHGMGKKLGPGRRCHRTYQNGTGLHLIELIGIENETGRGGDGSRADWNAPQDIARFVIYKLGFFELDARVLADLRRDGTQSEWNALQP